MRIKLIDIKGTWRSIADSARTTIGKDAGQGEPSSDWKRRMLLSEHSPTRKLIFSWKWYGLKYWVSVHLVRHWLGIVHYVSTQRDDRTETDISRDDIPQSAPVTHEAEANAQAIINISRRRLCMKASPETREAWELFLDECVKDNEPELYNVCVPDCIYRGWCYEYESCGFHHTEGYKLLLSNYRRDINKKEVV